LNRQASTGIGERNAPIGEQNVMRTGLLVILQKMGYCDFDGFVISFCLAVGTASTEDRLLCDIFLILFSSAALIPL
jgi:hypothetical protein